MRLLNFIKRNLNPFTSSDDDDFTSMVRNSMAGVRVTPETAIKLGAVYACVRVISETIASVPLITYELSENKQKPNPKDPLYKLLYHRPNPWMSSYDFFRLQMKFVLLKGNAYTEIIRKRGAPEMLVPLHPDRVRVELNPSLKEKVYFFRMQEGKEREIKMANMLHFKGMSGDGLTGLGVIDDIAKEAVGLGLAQEQYGARAFGQRANIAGILHYPTKLTDESHKRIADSWNKVYGGVQNSHKVAITEGGMKFEPVSMTNEAAQFIAARQYQVEEICRIFRVPPHKIMDLSHAHYNNIEHSATEFITDSCVPWGTCIEKEIDWILVGEDQLDKRHVRFNFGALLRGDTKTRAEVQSIRLNNGMQSINEARAEENWNPIGAEGDVHRIPLNTGNADGSKPDNNPAAVKPGKDAAGSAKKQRTLERSAIVKDAERLKYAYVRTFEDAIALVCRREVTALRAESRKNLFRTKEKHLEFFQDWGKEYAKLVPDRVRGVVYSWVESVIFFEKLGITEGLTPRNIENSTELADKMASKWGDSYGEESTKLLCGAVEGTYRDYLEPIIDEIERTRARKEAERWVSEIQAEVRIALFGEVRVEETPPPAVQVTAIVQAPPIPKTEKTITFGVDAAGNKTATIKEEVVA